MIFPLSLNGDRGSIICIGILPGFDVKFVNPSSIIIYDPFVVVGDGSNDFLVGGETAKALRRSCPMQFPGNVLTLFKVLEHFIGFDVNLESVVLFKCSFNDSPGSDT